MGLFDGKERIAKIIRQGGSLERWYSNSSTPVMQVVEKALLRDGKDVSSKKDEHGNQVLEYRMFHKNDQLTVIIMEDACLGLTIHTIYPVDTEHLSRNEIDAILQDANNYCKTGVVMHNEGPDIFSYVLLYNTNEFVPEGISIDVLLHTASEETDYVLEYLDRLKEQFNLYTFEEIMESYN